MEIRSEDVLPTIPGKIALEQLSNNCKIFQKLYYTNNSGIGRKKKKQQLLCNTTKLFCIRPLLMQTRLTHFETYCEQHARTAWPAAPAPPSAALPGTSRILQPRGSRKSLPRPATLGYEGPCRAWCFLHRNGEIIKFGVMGYRISFSMGISCFSPRPTQHFSVPTTARPKAHAGGRSPSSPGVIEAGANPKRGRWGAAM